MVNWITYAMFEGFLWGCIFSHNGGHLLKDKPYNIHVAILPIRTIFFIMLVEVSHPVLSGVAFLLVFPFFHNGAYYETRSAWEPEIGYRWWSTSTTTTANTNFPFWVRCLAFLLGAFIWGVI